MVRGKRDKVCKCPRMICFRCLVCCRLLINNSLHLSSPPNGLLAFAPGSGLLPMSCKAYQLHLWLMVQESVSFLHSLVLWCPGRLAWSRVDSPFVIPTALPAALPPILSNMYISSCSFSWTHACVISSGHAPPAYFPGPYQEHWDRTHSIAESLPKLWTATHFKIHFLYKSKDWFLNTSFNICIWLYVFKSSFSPFIICVVYALLFIYSC